MKNFLFVLALVPTGFAYAQKAANTLHFTKGQKLEVRTNMNITSQSMMGPSSGTITITDQYAVNEVSPNAYTLVKVPKLMKMAFTVGSQEIQLDSDNPKDLEGPFGQPVKEIMSQKPEFSIDATGKIIDVKKGTVKTNENTPEANMMAMMLPGVNLSASLPQAGNPSIFQILPNREVGVGDTWTDSLNVSGNENVTIYKVKEITDKEIILDFVGKGNTVTTQNAMGMNVEVNASTNGTGTVILDKATGILKQKTTTNTTETAINLGGREITSTLKSTSVTNVTNQ